MFVVLAKLDLGIGFVPSVRSVVALPYIAGRHRGSSGVGRQDQRSWGERREGVVRR